MGLVLAGLGTFRVGDGGRMCVCIVVEACSRNPGQGRGKNKEVAGGGGGGSSSSRNGCSGSVSEYGGGGIQCRVWQGAHAMHLRMPADLHVCVHALSHTASPLCAFTWPPCPQRPCPLSPVSLPHPPRARPMHTLRPMYAHPHKRGRTHMRAHTNAGAHTCAHTQTRAHAHTHTHPAPPAPPGAFAGGVYDADDREADEIWDAVDQFMDERRRVRGGRGGGRVCACVRRAHHPSSPSPSPPPHTPTHAPLLPTLPLPFSCCACLRACVYVCMYVCMRVC